MTKNTRHEVPARCACCGGCGSVEDRDDSVGYCCEESCRDCDGTGLEGGAEMDDKPIPAYIAAALDHGPLFVGATWGEFEADLARIEECQL